jgi:hypothetical protein
MPNVSASHFSFDIGFTVRAIGSAGVAELITSGFFTYTQNASSSTTATGFTTLNNTSFDTTSSNTLNLTAQFSSTNSANFIYSEFFILNKTY